MDEKLKEKAKRWLDDEVMKFKIQLAFESMEDVSEFEVPNAPKIKPSVKKEKLVPEYVIDYLIEESKHHNCPLPPTYSEFLKYIEDVKNNKKNSNH